MTTLLDFEKPVGELRARADDLRARSDPESQAEAAKLDERATRLLADLYHRLTPWQKTLVARHPERPHFRDYVSGLIDDWTPLAGDRRFGEDAAIVGGVGRFRGRPLMVIGHEKGHDTASRVRHNFGMGRPEGYRKAARLMELAGRFGLPVLTLVDTPGAYPGLEGEARGVAEAIAFATQVSLDLPTPMIAAIVGEGMSGGAIGIAAGNRVIMFEHAVYAVISPEGCASILWRTADAAAAPQGNRAADAAVAMRITAEDLKRLTVVDRVIREPLGGAHREPERATAALGEAIAAELARLEGRDAATLRRERRQKFLDLGQLAA